MSSKESLLRIFVIGSATALLTLGCASTKPKLEPDANLDREVKAQPEANTPEDIAKRAAEAFANAPGLTSDQRIKLLTIYSRTYSEAMAIRKEIGQSKSLLFQLVASTSYKSSDVEKLKSKVVALDKRRLDIMFTALRDVQNVVGFGEDKKELYRRLEIHEMPFQRAALK